MKVLITGVAGTGKTTVGNTLAEDGYQVIDLDSVSDWFDTRTNKFHPRGSKVVMNMDGYLQYFQWRINPAKFQAKKSKTKLDKNLFLVGNVDGIEKIATQCGFIFFLDAPLEVLFNRYDARDNAYGKKQEERDAIAKYKDSDKQRMRGLGAIVVDTNRLTVEETVNMIISCTTQ
ncbi:TPA: dephospho-CoA kinase [Candidatus Saccharibacteria bacterium]|nr:dephospho-CoA kinase [Candidatus Saccharibacteria bacterium]HIO87218.1 dephospho-CoA kinase [Candidatus Saccharibacteria bacterium]